MSIKNVDDQLLNEFLKDLYEFNKKWTTPKIAKIFGMTKQAVYLRVSGKKNKKTAP